MSGLRRICQDSTDPVLPAHTQNHSQHAYLEKRQAGERVQRCETQKVKDRQHRHQDQNTPSATTSGGSGTRDACLSRKLQG